jgi:hypothetical protein
LVCVSAALDEVLDHQPRPTATMRESHCGQRFLLIAKIEVGCEKINSNLLQLARHRESGATMGKQPRINLRVTDPENRQTSIASRFSVQHGIEELQKALAALNEQISELENEGLQGDATDALKANSMDLACQIDELRCLLLVGPKQ